MRLGSSNEIAEGSLRTFAQGMKSIHVDFRAIFSRTAFVGTHVLYDSGDSVDNGFHGRQNASGRIRSTCGQEAVDSRDERGDVDVEQATIWRYRQLVLNLRRLKEKLGSRCT